MPQVKSARYREANGVEKWQDRTPEKFLGLCIEVTLNHLQIAHCRVSSKRARTGFLAVGQVLWEAGGFYKT